MLLSWQEKTTKAKKRKRKKKKKRKEKGTQPADVTPNPEVSINKAFF